jgi:hypothetical protein
MEMDYLLKDGIRKEVNRRSVNGKTGVAASRAAFPTRHINRCDPFTRGLLALNVPGTVTYVPFEQLIERANKVRGAKEVVIAGKKLILVSLSFDRDKLNKDSSPWEVEIYFDPKVNYLVSKTVYRMSGSGTFRRDDQVIKFKECGPGLFFPEQVQGTAGDGAEDSSSHMTQMADVRVNQALPPDSFSFRYPNGVYLDDLIKGTRYKVDPNGNPMSTGEPLARNPPPPLAEGVRSEAMMETQEEPKSLSRLILPVTVCLVVLGLVAILARRWRGKANAS